MPLNFKRRWRRWRRSLDASVWVSAVIAALLLGVCAVALVLVRGKALPPPAQVVTPTDARFTEAQVVRVVDGDTIKVALAGQTISVRYIGIDAAELGTTEGATAREQNSILVSGRTVRLERDVSETDRYGRLLRYVWVDDVMVNAALVQQGYARAAAYPPDIRYEALLAAQQRDAESARRGLWDTVARAAQAANLRAGPGTAYPRVGGVPAGQALQIVARDATGGWYQLAGGAWIAGELVSNAPDVPMAKGLPRLTPGATTTAPRP